MRWEYKIAALSGPFLNPHKELNKLGDDGWELVGVSGKTAYLKRPLPSNKGDNQ